MRRVVKWGLVVLLLSLFTIFCASDYRRWRRLGQDVRTGDLYYYEEKSLARNDRRVYRVRLKVERAQGQSQELFEVDCPAKTIRNLTQGTPAEAIPAGSIAENLWSTLRDLP